MDIEAKVQETIEKYHLANKKDKIAVALSGGKDSTSLLYILHKFGYNVQGLMIDLDLGEWSKTHNKNMTEFCKQLDVPLTIVDLKKEFGHGICYIKAIVKKQKNVTGCTVCGIMKKYILNKWAKQLGVDKIATGHNLDDESHTVIMNFLKGNLMLGVNSSPATGLSDAPVVNSKLINVSKSELKGNILTNSSGGASRLINRTKCNNPTPKGFVQRIKPLFFVPEDEIRNYAKKMKFPILFEKCPCAIGTYRVETREWMNHFSNEQKLKIVEGFQKVLPELKKRQTANPAECRICGEPARNDICNACRILEFLK